MFKTYVPVQKLTDLTVHCADRVTSLFNNYMSIGYDFLGASTYKACLVEVIGVVANYNGNAFEDNRA